MKRRIGDRRAKPRFEIVGDLWGSVDIRETLTVLNLGRGGALLESSAAFAPGPAELVRALLAAPDGESYPIVMRVRHSTKPEHLGRGPYRVGVEFVDVSPELDEFLIRHLAPENGGVSAGA
jgi:c-di-GMP-binding flagellar brake protein YcgR